MKTNMRAFTLMELLVVVLIIGILAAVAMPPYQRAVLKSRASTILPLVRSLGQAQEHYYLSQGVYASTFEELDIDLPTKTGTCQFRGMTSSQECFVLNDWEIGLYPNDASIQSYNKYGSLKINYYLRFSSKDSRVKGQLFCIAQPDNYSLGESICQSLGGIQLEEESKSYRL